MKNLIVNDKLNNLLRELEFKDITGLVKDSLVTEILCRVSNFSEEVEHFERKYSKSCIEFKKEYETGEENFEKYDDLITWEFAQQGKSTRRKNWKN